MKQACNGCRNLKLEKWPKGVKAARCFSDLPPIGAIRHRGRVVELYGPEANIAERDMLPRVEKPSWCPGKH